MGMPYRVIVYSRGAGRIVLLLCSTQLVFLTNGSCPKGRRKVRRGTFNRKLEGIHSILYYHHYQCRGKMK